MLLDRPKDEELTEFSLGLRQAIAEIVRAFVHACKSEPLSHTDAEVVTTTSTRSQKQ